MGKMYDSGEHVRRITFQSSGGGGAVIIDIESNTCLFGLSIDNQSRNILF